MEHIVWTYAKPNIPITHEYQNPNTHVRRDCFARAPHTCEEYAERALYKPFKFILCQFKLERMP